MNRLLQTFLQRTIRHGTLEVVDPAGAMHQFGDGSGDLVRARFANKATELSVIRDPELKLGEAFVDGSFVVEKGSIFDFLHLVQSNMNTLRPLWITRAKARARVLTRRLRQMNHARAARKNVHHHYDLGNDLYRLFLDDDFQYSCGYFERPDVDLDEAQLAKKRHIAAKLALSGGERVLDIGSGWGGMGLYLARYAGSDVTGVTLSEEQLEGSNRRARAEGLAGSARFLLKDYRDLSGSFDRIVSVGMFEHVGAGHYREFFARCRNLLADDGVMLLHSIGRFDEPGDTNPWIRKYIFPGGYIPALSEVLPAIERNGLLVTDIEILRLHYAETLKVWRERFMANRDTAKAMYDERFCRMWEFYLAGSEEAFRSDGMMVFQIQLAKNQRVLPLTRNYMMEAEEELRRREQAGAENGRLAAE